MATPELPPERVGFADALTLMVNYDAARWAKLDQKQLSIPTTFCRNHLRSEGIALEHGNRAEIPSALAPLS